MKDQPAPSPKRTLLDGRPAERLHGSLAKRLAIQILRGELEQGYTFPGGVELAAQLGISRSALREAFQILMSKGLVEGRPKAGTKVTNRRQWSLLDPDLLAWQFEAEPTIDFLRDLFELRMMVEPRAAALAARRRSEAQAEAMGEALERMAQYGLADERGRLADQQFHTILLEATRNQAVIALASSIMAAIAWTTVFKQRNRALPRDPIPEHRVLFEAIAAGTPKRAEKAMAELIRLAQADTEISMKTK